MKPARNIVDQLAAIAEASEDIDIQVCAAPTEFSAIANIHFAQSDESDHERRPTSN